MTNSIIQGITDYFLRCPLLKDGVFHLDALGDKPVEYTIQPGIFEPIIRRYVNGDSERQYQFTFGSREAYSLDRINNLNNSEFYEALSAWVESQNDRGIFPDMPEGCEPRRLACLSSGYIFDMTGKSARYQIQLTLEYYKTK